MPAPSKRPGLNSATPDAIRPEAGSTAQPVRVPRSRVSSRRSEVLGGGAGCGMACAGMRTSSGQNGMSSPRDQSIAGKLDGMAGRGSSSGAFTAPKPAERRRRVRAG